LKLQGVDKLTEALAKRNVKNAWPVICFNLFASNESSGSECHRLRPRHHELNVAVVV
jgi:hypothetical protein